jgi:hypothetical protein
MVFGLYLGFSRVAVLHSFQTPLGLLRTSNPIGFLQTASNTAEDWIYRDDCDIEPNTPPRAVTRKTNS